MGDANTCPSYDLYDCTPNREQTWLLHAAVSGGDRAIQSWRSWRDQIELDDIDPASFRLLPLVYRNMVALGQDDPLLKRLKGVYRHTWYKNQILYRQAQGVLADLQQAGIAVMLLKGAALSDRFYRDDGKRFMNDVDIMVPHADFEKAAAIMLENGWRPDLYSSDAMFWYHRHQFKHGSAFKKQQVEIDLHSGLMRFMPQNDQVLWRSSIKGNWQGYPVFFLDDTDQLFHTCVHGVTWSFGFLSWIPDALAILRSETTEVSWPTLIETAQRTRTILYLRNALAYLVKEFQAPVPCEVVRELEVLPVSWVERHECRIMGQTKTNNIPYRLQRVLFLSCRYRWAAMSEQRPVGLSLTGWIGFLVLHVHPPSWWPTTRNG
jgi:hypothetical protein